MGREGFNDSVLAFARVPKSPQTAVETIYSPDTAAIMPTDRKGPVLYEFLVVAISLSEEAKRFYVDLSNVSKHLSGIARDTVFEFADIISLTDPFYLDYDELVDQATCLLQPYCTVCWRVRVFAMADLQKELIASSVERMLTTTVDDFGHGPVRNNFLYRRILNAVASSSVSDTFRILASNVSVDLIPFIAGAVHKILYSLVTAGYDSAVILGLIQYSHCSRLTDFAGIAFSHTPVHLRAGFQPLCSKQTSWDPLS